ncbi:MAG: hypothetical protein HN963_02480 [Thiotrichales bacterium]|nr:hypothetical protein [Thiotrichales bacterium]MBT3613580.1 hypothetical protein [Thiotrichales bacterium]MBT3837975.1 hypothetical protein [Thiotrichales bacterium]MBT4261146.1 hypothetical protein [Thiotrichales bacterium]MBT7005778.1 hypothetical protein [Thiotrichales bacterium]
MKLIELPIDEDYIGSSTVELSAEPLVDEDVSELERYKRDQEREFQQFKRERSF